MDRAGADLTIVRDLGREPFAPVRARMLALAEAVRKGEAKGEVWLVEHDPVYTAGRGTTPAEITEQVVAIERGGKVTYHGPGQLVVYPILALARRDARAWLRALEAFGVAICAELGLAATASVDGTGVFVAGKKIASIGVAIRHWVSIHGIAINVAMDLQPFFAVRPCGLDPSTISDLSHALGRTVSLAEVKELARAQVSLLARAVDP